MSSLWLTIGLVALASAAIKGAGPLLLGSRELPPRALGVIILLAPAILTALVITGTFSEQGRLTLDARAAGVATAAAALALRAPLLLAVTLAAVVTAALRALA